MGRIGAFFAVPAVVAGVFVCPLWGAPHHFHHYQRGQIEKVSVEENGVLGELGGQDSSPAQQGIRYVVVVTRGSAEYSGEFYVESKDDYPITVRPGQRIRFRTSRQQMLACDVHTMMMLITVKYLVLRDPQGKDWDLFLSSTLPPYFNADIRPGYPIDGADQP